MHLGVLALGVLAARSFEPGADVGAGLPEMRDGIERAWWTDVESDEVESELAWLRETVYGGTWGYLPPGGLPQRRVTAFERWRTEPGTVRTTQYARCTGWRGAVTVRWLKRI